MRRIFVEEESTPHTTQPVSDAVQEQAEQEVSQETIPVRKKPANSGRALRWTILISGTLGIFALLTPVLTGIPLTEWLQSADFKAAYSSKNMAFMRGMGALKAGNLAVATDALMELSPTSTEADDLGYALFPKLIEAKDYERAARISGHMIPGSHGQANPALLGSVLGTERGLSGALEFLTQNPDNRKLILPGVFVAVVPKELTALEKLVPTLSGEEQASAVQAIVQTYTTAHRFEDAWKWTEKLPEPLREPSRVSLVSQETIHEPKTAIGHLKALKPSDSTNAMRHSLARQLAFNNAELARRVAETVSDPSLKKSLLAMIESQARELEEQKKRLAGVDKLPTAEAKIETLLSVLMSAGRTSDATAEILPRMMALAQKNPSLINRHDTVMRFLVVSNGDRKTRQKYLGYMINPGTRAALIEELKSNQDVSAELNWDHGSGKASGAGNMDLSSPDLLP